MFDYVARKFWDKYSMNGVQRQRHLDEDGGEHFTKYFLYGMFERKFQRQLKDKLFTMYI